MLDILIGSLLVALVCVAIYWMSIAGLKKEEEPAKPENVKLYTVGDEWCLFCESDHPVHKIVKPTVNEKRAAVSVEEQHIYHGGLDITIDPKIGGDVYSISSIKGTPSEVKRFIKTYFRKESAEHVFKAWNL